MPCCGCFSWCFRKTRPQKACEGSKTPHRRKDRWAVRSGKVDTVSTAGTPDSTGDPGAQQKGQLDTRPYSQGEEVSCVVQTELPQHSPSSAQQSAPDRGGAADGRQVQEKTSPRTSSPGLPDTELSGSDTLAAHNRRGQRPAALFLTGQLQCRVLLSRTAPPLSVRAPFRETTQLLGVPNLGNSCYMNAALQCLSGLPSFSNYILREGHSWDTMPQTRRLRLHQNWIL
ncbi:ubiquitin carboxyl-terminal hydrolase 29-like isoform X2 [Lepisosteus oculatus]|uniref:ubiquitin carboxyl-terminal hydrolase 29-like isoform X2 n=1 Tax=Lepisosteus oculatus TaxID=7918 RepID=UPI0035F51C39